jgi:hypothetical protein
MTSSKIEIKNGVYRYGKLELPLYSGEWSYWAVIRDNWKAVAESVKKMGIRIVSSYVPWSYHEISENEYDWTGRTGSQRDLVGFIDLLKEEGLYLILRPGPYIYAGWPHGGPPERIGGLKHDRLSPEFIREGRRYIEAICRDVIAPRQVTKGGNIIMLQADNEPFPCVEQQGDEIGCFGKSGMFKDWLKRKYRDKIDGLNRRWNTSYASFDEAAFYFHEVCVNTDLPMAERLLPSVEYRFRYADSFEFIGWYAAEVVRVVSGWMRESGIDIPISANSWSPLYADFGKFCEVADIAGMDLYPSPNFTRPVSAVEMKSFSTRDNWITNVDSVKMAEANVSNGNVWCGEFQAGIYPITKCGYIPPGHFRFITLALMAHGLRAWNWYLLVTQYNWPNSPINEWGWPNEYFPVHKETLELTNRIEPWNLTALNDVGLVVYKPHRVIDPGNFESVFNALETGNIRCSYVDPQASLPLEHPVLVYSGAEWMAGEDLAKLEAFVEKGGTLITFSRAPLRDERGNPTRIPFESPQGARPVNLPVFVYYRNGAARLSNAGHLGCKINLCWFPKIEGDPLRVNLSGQRHESLELLGLTGNAADSAAFTMGYTRRFGKGKVIFIGSNPSPDILRMVLEQEGHAPCAAVDKQLVTTSLFRHAEGHHVLFVINRNPYACAVNVKLNPARLQVSENTRLTIIPISEKEDSPVNVDFKAGVRLDVAAYDAGVFKVAAKSE